MGGVRGMTLIGMFAWSGAAWADCDQASLRGHLDDGVQAWQHADADGLEGAHDGALSDLACFTEVIRPVDAADLHQLEALTWFQERLMSRVEDALVASRAADGRDDLDPGIAQAGHPLHLTFERSARRAEDEGVELALPDGVVAWVDGTASTRRPRERPYVLQLVGADGTVLANRYLLAEERFSVSELLGLPEAPAPSTSSSTVLPQPVPPTRQKITGGQVALLSAGGVLLAGSGALLGVALSERSAYLSEDTADADLDGHRNTANALGYAAQGSLAAGLVCVGMAFAVPF